MTIVEPRCAQNLKSYYVNIRSMTKFFILFGYLKTKDVFTKNH